MSRNISKLLNRSSIKASWMKTEKAQRYKRTLANLKQMSSSFRNTLKDFTKQSRKQINIILHMMMQRILSSSPKKALSKVNLHL
jgi:flavin-dependent dehydrogenase